MVLSTAAADGSRTSGPRRRFHPVALGFAGSVLAEILAFILVCYLIGFGWAVLALVVLSLAGLALFVRQTPKAWRDLRRVAEAGERPGPQLTRHLAGLAGAILIAVPGFLSTLVGLSLFLPPVRMLAGRAVTGFATRRMSSSVAGTIFGPRRVRVKVGKTARADRPADPAAGPPAPSGIDEPIEGEIV